MNSSLTIYYSVIWIILVSSVSRNYNEKLTHSVCIFFGRGILFGCNGNGRHRWLHWVTIRWVDIACLVIQLWMWEFYYLNATPEIVVCAAVYFSINIPSYVWNRLTFSLNNNKRFNCECENFITPITQKVDSK